MQTQAEGRAAQIYGSAEISERHRHRFEFNNAFREPLEAHGMVLSGTSPDERLVEMVELPEHPYFVGCQFHPEFKSRPMRAHPLFSHFVAAAVHRRDGIAADASRSAGRRRRHAHDGQLSAAFSTRRHVSAVPR